MKVAIVGGGLGGLTAARALVAAGVDAQVLEAGAVAGGVIATTRDAGYRRESAASSFLGGVPRGALALCTELGVAVDKASARAKRRWIYIDGKLHALPSNPIELARSELLTWRGKLALLREPFAPVRSPGGDESMHAFAARRFGVEAARAIVAPFVTGVFAADAHDISLEAGFPKLAALDVPGGVVRGMIGGAIRGMRGKREPKLPRGMYAPVGGLGALVDALTAQLGSRVHTGVRVHEIEPIDGGVLIDRDRWDGCVLAVPAEDGAGLVADAVPELATRLREFHRAPAALVYLGFAAADVPRAADGFGLLVAQHEQPRVLGVVFESTVWPDRAPEGHVLLRCIYGGARDPQATGLSDAELVATAQRDLEIVLGATATPVYTSVVRWSRGIAQYRIGHRERSRAAMTAGRRHRIALAGADYRGPGVNDICADAETVATEVGSW